jgi:hypothetical protein
MKPTLNKTRGLVLLGGTLFFSGGAWADELVPVASLEVKERIRTIDQINVTAETDKIAEAPSTEAVADLLEEARLIDAEDTADVAE